MDLTPILTNFKKQLDAQHALEHEQMQQKAQTRLQQAQLFGSVIKDIISPVMESCREQLKAAGFGCQISTGSKQDNQFAKNWVECALTIKLKTGTISASRLPDHLTYEWEFEGHVVREQMIRNTPATKTLPLGFFTREAVEADVMEFIKAAFKIAPA